MWRGRLGFAFVFLLWSRAGFALEANPRVALGLTRGEGTQACIQGGAIERAVERRLRRRVFAGNESPDLHIDVALARESDGAWSARLVLRGRSGAELGARELQTQAAHCSALDDALVLVVALLVDSPEARAQAGAASEPTAPAPSEAAQPTKGLLATIIGIALATFGASGVFGQLQDALNTIWEVEDTGETGLWSYLRTYLISFAGILVLGFLLAVSSSSAQPSPR